MEKRKKIRTGRNSLRLHTSSIVASKLYGNVLFHKHLGQGLDIETVIKIYMEPIHPSEYIILQKVVVESEKL